MSQSSSPWAPHRRTVLHYTTAIVAVVVALVSGLLLDHFLQATPFLLLFLCAILLAASLGGAGPGLLATGLSTLAFIYYLIPPLHSFAVAEEEVPRIILFVMTALFAVLVCAAQRRTAESFRRAREDLQETVQELEQLNKALKSENAQRLDVEQDLRQAEQELQVTIDTIPAIVVRYRHDGAPDFFNQIFLTYTGLPQASFPGRHWVTVLHPDDLPRIETAWRAHLPTGQPFEMEQRLRRADGEYRWFLVRRVPLRDENGEVIRWYGVAHDIEDRKQTERALRRSEAYLAEAQRLSHTGSFRRVISRGDAYWSKEMYSIMEFDETVPPTNDMVLARAHPDDRKRVEEELNRAVRGERDYDYEHRLLMPDGTIKYVHVRAHRQLYETGEPELVGALMDVTAAKRAQEALQNAQTELAHVTRVTTLGEMSASIAHEVNQPLAAISANAEAALRWLGRDVPDIEEARTTIARIVNEAHRAGEVIRRIRDFSKKAGPQMTQIDIDKVIKEAVTLVEHEALRYDVAIRYELASGLPPVRGDRIQLQQVIVNFAVNGMEAMAAVRDRERVLTVRTQRHETEWVLVGVEDAGIGIEPENIDGVFNAFHTTKPNGLGMGLSICRSIIAAHGGRVWASCNAGTGMTFQFAIPACRQCD